MKVWTTGEVVALVFGTEEVAEERQRVFDALIAAANDANVVVLSAGLLSATMPLKSWLEKQQKAMDDASETD